MNTKQTIAHFPPWAFAKEAEKAVIGSLIQNPELSRKFRPSLNPDLFSSPAFQRILNVILEITDQGNPVDEIILGSALQAKGFLEESGGVQLIVELAQSSPIEENFGFYLQIVQEKSSQRKTIERSLDLLESGGDPKKISEVIGDLTLLSQQSQDNTPHSGMEVLREMVEILDSDFEEQLIPSGVSSLDELLDGGFRKKRLYILAARPSVGKSALAVFSIYRALKKQKAVPLLFSLEMPRLEIIQRIMRISAKVDNQKMDKKNIPDHAWTVWLGDLSQILPNFGIVDLSSVNFQHIRAVLSQNKGKFDILFVDHIHIMQTAKQYKNRVQEISEISRALKTIAMDFDIPVVALAQLNREIERRNEKKPCLADLRDSGSIEQDADVVMLMHRENINDEDETKRRETELIIAKNRSGRTGKLTLSFRGETGIFEEIKTNENLNPYPRRDLAN